MDMLHSAVELPSPSCHVSLPLPTLFPPILQSEPTSPEARTLEEPSLCKRIIYVHPTSEPWTNDLLNVHHSCKEGLLTNRSSPPGGANCSDRSERIVSSAWEQANEEQEKAEMSTSRQGVENGCTNTLFSMLSTMKQKLQRYGNCKGTVMAACSRVACCNVMWCLVMGAWLEQKTKGRWGILEVVLANVLCGSVFGLLQGHAIIITGTSSFSFIFTIAITTSGRHLGLDVVPWAGWIGIWGTVVLLLLALSGASKFMTHMTSFSWDVLQVFIGIALAWGALEQLVQLFVTPTVALDSALLSLWLASSAFFVAFLLRNMGHTCRCNAITEYGPLIILILFTALPHLPKLMQPEISQVALPRFGYHTDGNIKLGCIRLRILPFWAILLAIIPGIMLAGMNLICHSGMTALLQEKAGPNFLSKYSAKRDLFILAFLTFFCSLFGLPYSGGLLYQSTIHLTALTIKIQGHSDMENQHSLMPIVVVQRISGLVASLLPGVLLLPPMKRLVNTIPLPVLTGLLLQLACQSLRTWNIATILITTVCSKYRSKSRLRPLVSAFLVYSAAQLSCIFLVFISSLTPAAVLFPLFFFATLLVRHFAMRALFRREDFAKLDSKLTKEYSDFSSSDQLSMVSPQAQVPLPPQWPQLAISQSLKTAISAPMAEVMTPPQDVKNELASTATCESPMPTMMSTSLLSTSSRRLKERTRRRHKRKRQASFEAAVQAAGGAAREETDEVPIPPLVRAMMDDHHLQQQYEEEEINLSKRVSPKLSPQFFRKSKPKPKPITLAREAEGDTEKPLEVHSNLLYEPTVKTNSGNKAKRMMEDTIQQAEISRVGCDPSSSQAHCLENKIEVPDDSQQIQNAATKAEDVCDSNNRTKFVFQGSPGIGRSIRTSPSSFYDSSKSNKGSPTSRKRQLQLPLSLSRKRAPLKEDTYPVTSNAASYDMNAGLRRRPGARSGLLYPRLRKCRTSRWPTTHTAVASPSPMACSPQQQQRHSTSQPTWQF